MIGAQLLVSTLQEWGVSFIATLCGHNLNSIDDACREAGMRLVDVRNEQAASYIADAWGRLSRRVGVCAVSSGVAHVNALAGLVNAYFDGAPMLLITGSGPTSTAGMGHFQDLDQVALAAPVCKYARVIDRAERIPLFVHEACTAALSGRPGPVHLTFPEDIQKDEVNPAQLVRVATTLVSKDLPSQGDPRSISEATSMIVEAKKPLLVAGSGVYYAEAEAALAEFVNSQCLPVMIPIWDRGSIPRPIGEFLGFLGAASGGPCLLGEADLIVIIGAACDYRVGFLQPPEVAREARIVRIEGDPGEFQKEIGAHLSILGDPRSVLIQLNKACQGRPTHETWLREAQKQREVFLQRCLRAREQAGSGLHALDILRAVRSVLTENTVIVIDGGNIGQWVHQVLFDHYPGHWLSCGASGVVGYGLPAAMAARLLYPDRPIILISGDGALTFSIAELETASRQRLGFVVLVADDEAWGVTLTGHQREFGQGITSELGPIRFDHVAKGMGAEGLRVSDADEIEPAIRKGLKADRPTLIHVKVVRSSPTD